MNAGHVRVECRIGDATFPRCTADMYEPNVLTITSLDDDAELRVFPPGTWISAVAYDGNGNIAFAFYAGQSAEVRKAS